MIKYPVRCRILDVTGDTFLGTPIKTPDISKPYIGEEGIAREIFFEPKEGDMFNWYIEITLDNGVIIYGHECWWEPIE
jgi:hypothetical protein